MTIISCVLTIVDITKALSNYFQHVFGLTLVGFSASCILKSLNAGPPSMRDGT